MLLWMLREMYYVKVIDHFLNYYKGLLGTKVSRTQAVQQDILKIGNVLNFTTKLS